MLEHKLELYFPQIIQQIGWMLILVGVLALIKAIPLSNLFFVGFLILMGIILGWTSRGIRIDFQRRRINQYVGIFGIKLGPWRKLPELEKIIITKTRYSQQIHAWVSRSDISNTVFRSFLRGPGEYKVLFIQDPDPEVILDEAKAVGEKLDLPILDCTIKEPTWIQ